MQDHDPRIVDLYDEDNPDGPDHDRYRALADEREASSIVDLGCGTGILTVTLATGSRRVVGIDPSRTMLAVARRRSCTERVTWIEGDSTQVPDARFDLALMTGNVAQHIPDADWSRTLRDLRRGVRLGGTLAFESRDPSARAWEEWRAAAPTSRATQHGRLTEWMDADALDDRTVMLSSHARLEGTGETITEALSLVFRSRLEIERDLRDAGFDVESVSRDWAGTPASGPGRLMVFVARAH